MFCNYSFVYVIFYVILIFNSFDNVFGFNKLSSIIHRCNTPLQSQLMHTQLQLKSCNFDELNLLKNNKQIFQDRLIISSVSVICLSIAVFPIFPVYADYDSNVIAISIVKPLIDTFVNVMSVLFLARTVISWYPKTNLNEFPFNVIVWPTEALADPVRQIIPPAFGVDISSIVWLMILSFVREILTGQQGILTLIEKQTI